MPVAFTIAGVSPELLSAAQAAFLDGLAIACITVSGLCYAGVAALPGRRFRGTAVPASQETAESPRP